MNAHDLKQKQPGDDLRDLRDCLRKARDQWRLSVCFPGDPIPKGRPRMSRNGHAFTPARTRVAEKELAAYFRAHMGAHRMERAEGPLRVELAFYRATARRVDLDNLAKLVLDSLNSVAFADDSQIVELTATKCIDRTHPRTVIEITEIPAEVQP